MKLIERDWVPYFTRKRSKQKTVLKKYFNIGDITADLLISRGLGTIHKVARSKQAQLNDLYDPFLLKDMDKAVKRIKQARKNNERVMIFGDYDVDGTTSVAITYKALQHIGVKNLLYVVANRLVGYGLHSSQVEEAHKNKIDLIITVDCGTSDFNALETAKRLKIDVIVLDHHILKKKNIDAYAFINPKRKPYPFKNLCSAGVVFKLLQALQMKGERIKLKEYLDFVALATVADVVPLVDENRTLAKLGLRQLSRTTHTGLKAFLKANSYYEKKITSDIVGYILGPRINAAGRLKDPTCVVEMFLSEDFNSAIDIAKYLTKLNNQRKKIEHQIRDEALEIIEKEKLDKDRVLVLSSDKWHKGVVGIVASVLSDMFYRPCVMISIKDGIGYGSVRSFDFPLLESLDKCKELLLGYGGHKAAAGLSIKADNIVTFRKKINKIANKVMGNPRPTTRYDTRIKIQDLTKRLCNEIQELEPFGEGNQTPIFMIEDVTIAQSKITRDGEHLRLVVIKDRSIVNGIGFWMAICDNFIVDTSQRFDVLFQFEKHSYGEKEYVQMNLKDLKMVKLGW